MLKFIMEASWLVNSTFLKYIYLNLIWRKAIFSLKGISSKYKVEIACMYVCILIQIDRLFLIFLNLGFLGILVKTSRMFMLLFWRNNVRVSSYLYDFLVSRLWGFFFYVLEHRQYREFWVEQRILRGISGKQEKPPPDQN